MNPQKINSNDSLLPVNQTMSFQQNPVTFQNQQPSVLVYVSIILKLHNSQFQPLNYAQNNSIPIPVNNAPGFNQIGSSQHSVVPFNHATFFQHNQPAVIQRFNQGPLQNLHFSQQPQYQNSNMQSFGVQQNYSAQNYQNFVNVYNQTQQTSLPRELQQDQAHIIQSFSQHQQLPYINIAAEDRFSLGDHQNQVPNQSYVPSRIRTDDNLQQQILSPQTQDQPETTSLGKNLSRKQLGPTTQRTNRDGDLLIQKKFLVVIERQNAIMETSFNTRYKRTKTQYICQQCLHPKQFKSLADIEVHLRIHNGDKPFECEICVMKFNSKGKLTRHMKSQYHQIKAELQQVQDNSAFQEDEEEKQPQITQINDYQRLHQSSSQANILPPPTNNPQNTNNQTVNRQEFPPYEQHPERQTQRNLDRVKVKRFLDQNLDFE
eukprot:403358206